MANVSNLDHDIHKLKDAVHVIQDVKAKKIGFAIVFARVKHDTLNNLMIKEKNFGILMHNYVLQTRIFNISQWPMTFSNVKCKIIHECQLNRIILQIWHLTPQSLVIQEGGIPFCFLVFLPFFSNFKSLFLLFQVCYPSLAFINTVLLHMLTQSICPIFLIINNKSFGAFHPIKCIHINLSQVIENVMQLLGVTFCSSITIMQQKNDKTHKCNYGVAT